LSVQRRAARCNRYNSMVFLSCQPKILAYRPEDPACDGALSPPCYPLPE